MAATSRLPYAAIGARVRSVPTGSSAPLFSCGASAQLTCKLQCGLELAVPQPR
jgi:hypothetical protein